MFTSGATESNNLALHGVLRRSRGRRVHLVTSRIEQSRCSTSRALSKRAVSRSRTFPRRRAAGSSPEHVIEAIDADTQSSRHARQQRDGSHSGRAGDRRSLPRRGVLFHVDAAQSAGKLPLELAASPIDLCSLTAHKLCGPKGVGALYFAPRATLVPQIQGGEQERGLRAGTLATHQIVGMGKAYELADPVREAPRFAALRDRLWQALAGSPARGRTATRAAWPHVLNVAFPGRGGRKPAI